MTMKSTRM